MSVKMNRKKLEKLIIDELNAYAESECRDEEGNTYNAVIDMQFSDFAQTLADKILKNKNNE